MDREMMMIGALDPDDNRTVELWVAGPAALIVAKVHKIAERVGAQDRVRDKDALDVLRLLRAVDTADLADRVSVLANTALSADVSDEAIGLLPSLFGSAENAVVAMAVRAAGSAADADTIAASFVALANDLRAAISERA